MPTTLERREQRSKGTIRVVGIHDDDGLFDQAFWKTIPPAERLELVWGMVVEFLEWRGLDGDKSRLQRSVFRVERRGG